MENYKEELASLKEELNSRIDAVIAKIEKPKFELNKWYKIFSGSIYYIDKIEQNSCYGYGIDSSYTFSKNNKWHDYMAQCSINKIDRLATPKEVEEAIAKHFNSLFTINDKAICLVLGEKLSLKGGRFKFDIKSNRGYFNGVCVFQNGTWATPIKTKTIDEIADLIYDTWNEKNCHIKTAIKSALIKEKQTIIETLNNL